MDGIISKTLDVSIVELIAGLNSIGFVDDGDFERTFQKRRLSTVVDNSNLKKVVTSGFFVLTA